MKDLRERGTEEDILMSPLRYLGTVLNKSDECARYLDKIDSIGDL